MKTRGRPDKNDEDGRARLVLAARRCFTTAPYSQVTTRMLAQEAGVDAALIRYYFENKEGLYKAMFMEVTGEVITGIEQAIGDDKPFDLEDIFHIFYDVIKQSPSFPILMFKEIVLEQGICRDYLIDKLQNTRKPFFFGMLAQFKQQGLIKDELDDRLLILNLMGLLIFPWYMREGMAKAMGIEFNDEQLSKMATHNANMFKYGCFKEREKHED
ncbi:MULTISPECIES: TetR/AcrR family transcriptional regulator [unclassified Pseudoalteromonas]|uniref:TetR/AcrR family transcriptional regulator n=1 Tax=unclassified Pseudoalteromonas TaxID=194690 RepID=UPI002097CDC3|nr:TetR/AcrR family transcriptional regulator [Pseudoalteromonas sp. XMcav2-N]MCO7189498.1 TetR/AcrR family transcriptional regulator [Pseudoalteromonas sp. XMcav2-N]